ncbi:MAG TPA: hypothetical protein VEG44_10530 [Candidatus Acidoferrales bacterium]|nr:hypothetical protein [Candidatus Acidoferrales bacterium]
MPIKTSRRAELRIAMLFFAILALVLFSYADNQYHNYTSGVYTFGEQYDNGSARQPTKLQDFATYLTMDVGLFTFNKMLLTVLGVSNTQENFTNFFPLQTLLLTPIVLILYFAVRRVNNVNPEYLSGLLIVIFAAVFARSIPVYYLTQRFTGNAFFGWALWILTLALLADYRKKIPYRYKAVMLAAIVVFITMYHTGVLMEILLLANYLFVSIAYNAYAHVTDKPRLPVMYKETVLVIVWAVTFALFINSQLYFLILPYFSLILNVWLLAMFLTIAAVSVYLLLRRGNLRRYNINIRILVAILALIIVSVIVALNRRVIAITTSVFGPSEASIFAPYLYQTGLIEDVTRRASIIAQLGLIAVLLYLVLSSKQVHVRYKLLSIALTSSLVCGTALISLTLGATIGVSRALEWSFILLLYLIVITVAFIERWRFEQLVSVKSAVVLGVAILFVATFANVHAMADYNSYAIVYDSNTKYALEFANKDHLQLFGDLRSAGRYMMMGSENIAYVFLERQGDTKVLSNVLYSKNPDAATLLNYCMNVGYFKDQPLGVIVSENNYRVGFYGFDNLYKPLKADFSKQETFDKVYDNSKDYLYLTSQSRISGV